MKKIKQTKRFLAIMLIGLFIFSCNKDELTEGVSPSPQKQNTNVSIDLAQQVALSFSKTDEFMGKTDKSRLLYAWNSSPSPSFEEKEIKEVYVISERDEPAFYITSFNPSGFVFITATAKEEPILAFSEYGNFDIDQLPIGLNQWINLQKQRIISIKNSDIEIPTELLEKWDRYVGHSNWRDPEKPDDPGPVPKPSGHENDYHIVKGPLMQTTWGQGCGYNNLISSSCGSGSPCNKPYTGCVATAMAQVMRYHRYPNNYNYFIMLNKIEDADRNSNGANEIAKLMRDVGIAVDMNYGCGGSGADTEDKVASSFRNDFGYSSASYHNNYNRSNKYEWVKSEINAGRPVIFRGGSKKYWAGIIPYYADGHAWVCDGYVETKSGIWTHLEFYMNWGWNGRHNGWYSFNNFNPGNSTYNYNLGIVTNIKT